MGDIDFDNAYGAGYRAGYRDAMEENDKEMSRLRYCLHALLASDDYEDKEHKSATIVPARAPRTP